MSGQSRNLRTAVLLVRVQTRWSCRHSLRSITGNSPTSLADAWSVYSRVEAWRAEGTSVVLVIVIAENLVTGMTIFSTIRLSDHGGYEIATMASGRNESVVKVVFDAASYVVDATHAIGDGHVFAKVTGPRSSVHLQ